MDREKDAEKKKKKKKQEDAYTKSKVMRAPPQRRAPLIPTNFTMDKQKMEMVRRKIRSQNQIKDAQMEMVRQKNMEIQRQNQMMQIQRQNQMRDLRQMNEQNMRVQQMSRGKKA